MQDILNDYNVNSTSVSRAVQSINGMDEATLTRFNLEFGLSGLPTDAIATAAKYAAHAVINGAETPEKVEAFVRSKLGPSLEAIEVEASPNVTPPAPEQEAEQEVAPAADTAPKRGRGRPKLAETAYDRARAIMEAQPDQSNRKALIEAVVNSGVKATSAAVYASRYYKERATV